MLSAFERNGLSINYSDSKRAAKDVKFGKMRYRSENSKYFSRRLSVGIAATSCFVLFLALGLRWIDKDEPIVVADTLSVEAAEESSPLVTTAEESEEAMTQETSELAVLKETEDKTVQETAALAVALGEAEETREVAVDDEKNAETDTQALNALREELAVALTEDDATDNDGKQRQTEMRAVIDGSDKKLSGEELAALVGEVAESHQDEEEITDKEWRGRDANSEKCN